MLLPFNDDVIVFDSEENTIIDAFTQPWIPLYYLPSFFVLWDLKQ